MGNPRNISFRNQYCNPPSNVYVENGGAFRVSVWASVACTVNLSRRMLRPPFEITPSDGDTVVISAPSTGQVTVAPPKILPEMEGFLLSFRVSVTSGTVLRGQCWIVVEYTQATTSGGASWQTLLNGYVTSGVPISFPQSPLSEPGNGNGAPIAQNADAVNVFTVAANKIVRVEGAFFNSVTNGVSTVRVKLTASSGPEFPAEANQPISTNYTYNFFNRSYVHTQPAGTPVNIYEEMKALLMRSGDTLTAGSVISTGSPTLGQLSLYGQEWVTP